LYGTDIVTVLGFLSVKDSDTLFVYEMMLPAQQQAFHQATPLRSPFPSQYPILNPNLLDCYHKDFCSPQIW